MIVADRVRVGYGRVWPVVWAFSAVSVGVA